jgi:hypothetical protein
MKIKFVIIIISVLSISVKAQNSYVPESNSNYKSAVGLKMDNDFFFQTDYYYSAGESIVVINPIISKSPFNRLLISILNLGDVIYNGLRIDHKIYTPTDTPRAGLKIGDRPYSSTFTLSQFQVVENNERGYRMSTTFSLGVIGENAQGYKFQSIIHKITPSEEPLGWEYQIKNDFLINYNLKFDKRLFQTNNFEWLATGTANLGTVNTDLSISTTIRTGIMDSYFESYAPKEKSGFKTWIELSYQARAVLYNANLQGGIFNQTSPNIINTDDVNRLIHKFGIHFYLQYNQHRMVLDAYRLSPEFKNSMSHMWGGITYQYWF